MLAVLGRLVDPRPELLDLVGLVGEGERAGLLEVAVDVVGPGELDQVPQVVDALLLEALELVGEVADPVGQAVGQARLAEAAVPSARAEADGLGISSTATRRPGSVSVRASAVHRPVNPPPTMATSTSRLLSGRQRRIGTPAGAGSRSQ